MKRVGIWLMVFFALLGVTTSVSAEETNRTIVSGVYYKTHVQDIGWEPVLSKDGATSGTEGKSLRLEGIQLSISPDLKGHIEYKTHIQDVGWESSWRKDGTTSGTEARSLRLEAIQIRLVDMPGYSIEYKTHVQNEGWEKSWKKDGEVSGSVNKSQRLEGIQVRLVKTTGDLTAYTKLLKDIAALDSKLYSVYSWNNLNNVKNSNKVTESSKQSDIDSAVDSITEAVKALEKLSDSTVYSARGTYGTDTVTNINKDVVIDTGDVKLQNMRISGDLILSDKITTGTINLENVSVDGNIYSRGYLGNLTYKGSKQNTLIIQALKGSNIYVQSTGTSPLNVVYSDETKVKSLNSLFSVFSRESITLDGAYNDVDLDKADLDVNVIGASYIDHMTFGYNASGSKIIKSAESTINTITLDSTVAIEGDGTVKLLEANADSITYTKTPTEVVTAQSVLIPPKLKSILVTGITINTEDNSNIIFLGSTKTVTSAVLPENASNKEVEYSIIEGTGTASIAVNGVITPKTAGTITVRATAKDTSEVKAIKTFVIKEAEAGVLYSSTTTIPSGTANPVIVVTVTGDTFTNEATTASNWVLSGKTGLSVRSITKDSNTQVTIYTTGKASVGELDMYADTKAMTKAVKTNPLKINVYLNKINLLQIPGVTVPATNVAPSTSTINTDQYTGTVVWYPYTTLFKQDTVYTANIVLIAKEGYTLEGLAANSFTVPGATTTTHAAGSGTIIATFPATKAISSVATLTSGTLGTVTITGDFSGGTTIPSSSALQVELPVSKRTNAVLSIVKASDKAVIKYLKNTGTAPTLDSQYTTTLSTGEFTGTLQTGDTIWVLVTAEDLTTKRYYKIVVKDEVIIRELESLTLPTTVEIGTELTDVTSALNYLNTTYKTANITTTPVGTLNTVPITWTYLTEDNGGLDYNINRDTANVFTWTVELGSVRNTAGLATTGKLDIGNTWIMPMYNVTFSTGVETTVNPITVERGSKITEPIGLSKEGYTLAGWYSDQTYLTPWVFNSSTITKDTTLYAKWLAGNSSITFVTNGGSSVDAKVGSVDSTIVSRIMPVVTKDGFTFSGWYETEDFSTPQVTQLPEKYPVGGKVYYAKWTALEASINFNTNGGDPVAPIKGVTGGSNSSTLMPTTFKNGYTLEGWYDNELLTGNKVTTLPSIFEIGSKTYYAKWTINTYKVSFEENGGTEVLDENVDYEGTLNVSSKVTTRDNYTFGGWFKDSICTQEWNNTTDKVTADVTLYAKWTINGFVVSFETNGGSSAQNQYITVGESASEPVVTKTGHTLEGWYSNTELTEVYNFNTAVTQDTIVYAKWNINSYNVTFNDGTVSNSILKEYNTTIDEPVEPNKVGYQFIEWCTDAGCTTPYVFSNKVTEDTTLFAKWKINEYQVAYEENGGDILTDLTVIHGASVSEPTISREGYSLNGWFTDAGLTIPYTFGTAVTGPLTLYAKWDILTFTVLYEQNNGSTSNVTVNWGSTITPPSTLTKVGYDFLGWYTDSSFTKSFDTSTEIKDDTTLYAKWSLKTFDVVFNVNGGSEISSIKVDYGVKVAKPSDPIKIGYDFSGFYSDDSYASLFDFDQPITENKTIYVKWTIQTYTIYKVINSVPTIVCTADYNTKISEPDSTKAGHVFNGWYKEDTYSTLWDFNTNIITGDTYLYPKWTINTYQVSFDSKGGSLVSTITTNYDTSVTKPSNPTLAGFTFVDWYTDSALTSKYDFATKVTADVKLYAKWVASLEAATWDEIRAIADAGTASTYYKIGDEKTVSISGVSYKVKIIGFNKDTKSDGTGTAGITFMLSGLYADKDTFNTASFPYNYDGWNDSDIRAYLNGFDTYNKASDYSSTSIYSKLPSDLKNNIVRVNKSTSTGVNYPAISTTKDFLYLLSEAEVGLTAYGNTGEGTKYDYFTNDASRIKTYSSGTADWWMLRSTHKTDANNIIAVDAYGADSDIPATYQCGLSFAFSVGSTKDCTITFERNSGSVTASQTIKYGNKIIEPTDPTRPGLNFIAWYKDAAFTKPWNFKYDTVTSDTTLYARWATLPAAGTSLNACSWDQIKMIADSGDAATWFKTGDQKTISINGGSYAVRIIDFYHDIGSDGSITGITFQLAQGGSIISQLGVTDPAAYAAGWKDNNSRAYLNGVITTYQQSNFTNNGIYPTLNTDLKVNIEEVSKISSAGYGSSIFTTVKTNDKLFLFSDDEVRGNGCIGNTARNEGYQYSYFKSSYSTAFGISTSYPTLTRSYQVNGYNATCINFDGSLGAMQLNSNAYPIFGFCV